MRLFLLVTVPSICGRGHHQSSFFTLKSLLFHPYPQVPDAHRLNTCLTGMGTDRDRG